LFFKSYFKLTPLASLTYAKYFGSGMDSWECGLIVNSFLPYEKEVNNLFFTFKDFFMGDINKRLTSTYGMVSNLNSLVKPSSSNNISTNI
jgi:hypothetical protein